MSIIYTDGSYRNGKCGYGIVVTDGINIKSEYFGYIPNGTNNVGELTAILKAIELTEGRLVIYSDSLYSINSLTIWYKKWEKNNWKTSNKKDVKNKELICSILKLKQGRYIEFKHVKAHSGIKFNERADFLANIYTNNDVKYP